MSDQSVFSVSFKVRDYELDMQGIVNNSVYFNYLEHARHEYLITKGVDVAALAKEGINLVLVRSEIDYKASKGRSVFIVLSPPVTVSCMTY
jgi:acyl-CoA thioester hydrolase